MLIATDLETNSLEWQKPEFKVTHFGWACADPRNRWNFEAHCAQLEQHDSKQILEDNEHIVHNSRFEGNIFKHVFKVNAKIEMDTQLYAWACEPWRTPNSQLGEYGKSKTYKLEDLLFDTFGTPRYKGNEKTWEDWQRRNLMDTQATYSLYRYYSTHPTTSHVHPGTRMYEFIKEVMVPCHTIYGHLKIRGVHIDNEYQQQFFIQASSELGKLSKECVRLGFPEGGNLRSTEQIKNFLYGVLGIPRPPIKKTKTKEGTRETVDTTGDTYLAEVEPLHPFITKLREYRTLTRNISNHLDPNSNWFHPVLYPEWHMTRLITGRPQAASPSVMNLPTDERYRKLIKAPPGHIILKKDQSQIELRINAFRSRDSRMLEAFRAGQDLHTILAQAITGKSEPSKKERTEAKPANFGYQYGASWQTAQAYARAAFGVRWTDSQSKNFRNTYFQMYQELAQFHNKTRRETLMSGETSEKMLGMKWDLSKFTHSRQPGHQEQAVRDALNYPTQFLGAMMNLCGLQAAEELLPGSVFMTVHDEVDLYFPISESWEPCWDESHKHQMGCHLAAEDIVKIREFEQEWDKLWHKKVEQYFPEFDVPVIYETSVGINMGELIDL